MTKRTMIAEPGTQSIAFSREFGAPARLVFEAHVDPGLIGRWIGPRGTSMEMHRFEPRTGGGYEYAIVGLGGRWTFRGSFHEIEAPSRIVQTWEYLEEPGRPGLEVLAFVDLEGGRSRIDGHAVYLTEADRDAMIGDFESGRDTDFERLDEFLAEGVAVS